MINNRQNGRRRGRGGGQRQGGGGGGGQGQRDSGNRIDSRARGNANQLFEKYKNMARDAQMSGDRVTTEYYLQFADHYFRVLMDQRGRQDEQGHGQHQQRRPRNDVFDPYDDGDDFDADLGGEGEPIRADEQQLAMEGARAERQPRDNDRHDAGERRDGGERSGRGERRDDGRRFQSAGAPANDLDTPGDRGSTDRGSTDRGATDRGATDRGDAADEGAPRRRGRPRRQRDGEQGDAAQAGTGHVEAGQRDAERSDADPRYAGRRDGATGERGEAGMEADRLPPSLGSTTGGAEDDAADEAPKPRRRRARAGAAVESPAID